LNWDANFGWHATNKQINLAHGDQLIWKATFSKPANGYGHNGEFYANQCGEGISKGSLYYIQPESIVMANRDVAPKVYRYDHSIRIYPIKRLFANIRPTHAGETTFGLFRYSKATDSESFYSAGSAYVLNAPDEGQLPGDPDDGLTPDLIETPTYIKISKNALDQINNQ
jgi:hypothetical protein